MGLMRARLSAPAPDSARRVTPRWVDRISDRGSAAQAQALDQRFVARLVGRLDVVEQPATLGDHLDQSAARMVVLHMHLEVLGQSGDALGEHSHLYIRRSRIALVL